MTAADPTATEALPSGRPPIDGASANELRGLVEHLRVIGFSRLRDTPSERLLEAWARSVEILRDAAGAERQCLDGHLVSSTGLSAIGLARGLDVVCGGVRRELAEEVFARAAARLGRRAPQPGVTLVVLASNLPGLAAQPMLAALALRRPLVVKSPTAEPRFATALVRALASFEPGLADAFAAASWTGGNRLIEDPLLSAVDRVVAYGGTTMAEDLRLRAGAKLFTYGPKASLAVLDRSVDPAAVATGLASDIALFDQRGCLSVQAIYTAGDAAALAAAVVEALERLAETLPPGAAEPAVAAAVQQLRSEAEIRGLTLHTPPLSAGTVVVDPSCELRLSPGLRTVRIHPLADLNRLPRLLGPWRGRLQGAALAGAKAWSLEPTLRRLGLSRFAEPGRLQHADAGWHNGGVDPLEAIV